ncbi:MAG: argininosuccinate lyase [Deltaproteobacteria bacterium]|nr:argininosuccinate lyase [Deltaproteobacteria bacterium]
MDPHSLRLLRVFCAFGTLAAFCVEAAAWAGDPPALYPYLIEANRAQVVMLAERELLPHDQLRRIAGALKTAATEPAAPGVQRSPNYLALEARLVELIGPEASNIHVGRSRNDLGETMNRMWLRDQVLRIAEALFSVRSTLQKVAGAHLETVMPGFTQAVQAQPTTVAHFLLALDSSLERDGQRLRELYKRINRSPLGSGAFTTSGFPLDRVRLADLLAFDGLIENSYDAIMVSAADSKVEFSMVIGLSAINIGRFAQSLVFQYDDPSAGMVLDGPITTHSSAMPQKRNPSALERLRLGASEVLANAHASAMFSHNTPMYEVKDVREDHLIRLIRFADEAVAMFESLKAVLESLTIRRDVLRNLVDGDYSTMSELADTLLRQANVPFRTGYKVASELTTYGKAKGKKTAELTLQEVSEIFHRLTGAAFPLSEAQLRQAFDPAALIANRKGRGGPQPAETARMLRVQQQDVAQARLWVQGCRKASQNASWRLQRSFDALVRWCVEALLGQGLGGVAGDDLPDCMSQQPAVRAKATKPARASGLDIRMRIRILEA